MRQPELIGERHGITRLVVVDHRAATGIGRILDVSNIVVSESVQDEGRTLKVFIRDPLMPE